jgi:hypothetical protein
MARVVIRVPPEHARRYPMAGGGKFEHPLVALVPEDTSLPTCVLPVAPVALPNDGLAPNRTVIDPPGRPPLVIRGADQLHRITLTCTLVQRPGLNVLVEDQLAMLRALARSDSRVRLTYGPSEGGWWWIEDFAWDVEDRKAYSNEIARARAAIKLVRAHRPAAGAAPIAQAAGAVAPPPTRTLRYELERGARGAPRTWVWRRGDTFWKVAQECYGDPNRGPDIAAYNNFTGNPRRIKPGRIFRLPL